MRSSGILLPIFSLASSYGIGCLSAEAYHFIDFLKESGQKYWQILPLGPTSYGDSPYQSFSTFACNPYFIDLYEFIDSGAITKEEVESFDIGDHKEYVFYDKIYKARYTLLKKAFKNTNISGNEDYEKYKENNKNWLDDYALFMAIKDSLDGISWQKWPTDIKVRKASAMKKYSENLVMEIEFYKFMQYKFISQYKHIKKYANDNGIKIIGDIPIYVAEDSADAWANPKLFQFNKDGSPAAVAGCPPDAFSATGQLWGNPLYNWKMHKKTNFAWWKERISQCEKLYNVVRIDHFRGFDEYYSIPYGNTTAEIGQWEKGPGKELFDVLAESMENLEIIAEDLGLITKTVEELVESTGFPNMKVLHFGFDPYADNQYLPHNYNKNCVVYTGTHDNETTVGWYKNQDDNMKEFILDYLNINTQDIHTSETEQEVAEKLTRLAMMSPAKICIIPIQDYLGLDNSARINKPATLGDNWRWRLREDALDHDLAQRIYKLTKVSSRL